MAVVKSMLRYTQHSTDSSMNEGKEEAYEQDMLSALYQWKRRHGRFTPEAQDRRARVSLSSSRLYGTKEVGVGSSILCTTPLLPHNNHHADVPASGVVAGRWTACGAMRPKHVSHRSAWYARYGHGVEWIALLRRWRSCAVLLMFARDALDEGPSARQIRSKSFLS